PEGAARRAQQLGVEPGEEPDGAPERAGCRSDPGGGLAEARRFRLAEIPLLPLAEMAEEVVGQQLRERRGERLEPDDRTAAQAQGEEAQAGGDPLGVRRPT